MGLEPTFAEGCPQRPPHAFSLGRVNSRTLLFSEAYSSVRPWRLAWQLLTLAVRRSIHIQARRHDFAIFANGVVDPEDSPCKIRVRLPIRVDWFGIAAPERQWRQRKPEKGSLE